MTDSQGASSMEGRVCLVTGASSGIGKATVLGLASLGATVLLVCRNRQAGQAAIDHIVTETSSPHVALLLADLSSQAAIRQLVEDFRSRYSHLHVLVNNAGIAPIQRSLTADSIEMTLAVNYLAPFLITNLLVDVLRASAPARVVNVAGDFHRKATIQFDDLMFEKNYSGIRANNQAKLALILFTYEMARRLQGTGVTVNCLHPGAVATDAPLKDPNLSSLSRLLYKVVRVFFSNPTRGAATSVYLASSPDVEGVTGKYFIKQAASESSPESYDKEVSARLWKESAKLTGLTG